MGLRILFVTPYVPSPVRVRPYALIRELAKRGHRVTLVCLVQPAQEDRYLPEVEPFCHEVHPAYLDRLEPYLSCLLSAPTSMPLSVAYCRSSRARRLVDQLAADGDFDLVHTEFVRAVPLTDGVTGHPSLFDAVDCLTLAYHRSLHAPYVSPLRRLVALVEWLKMRRYEPRVLHRFERILASSPADRRALEQIGGRGVTVLPNGVDTAYFSFDDGPYGEQTLVFLGKMSYYVNVASVLWFYQQVLPLIRRQRPGIRFRIVGRDPIDKIKVLTNDDGIEVTGSVPDVRPYLTNAAVSVCPMVTGAGIQNKMLEAMALGTPTVATSLACQALAVEPGRQVLVADSADEFASCVLALLDSKALRQQVAGEARRYVEEHHRWEDIGLELETIYHDLLDRR
jgi:sugar transferase (PEP-CTERM/EpsH1 system associated)